MTQQSTRRNVTRRGVLAGTGAAFLSGCSGDDGSSPTPAETVTTETTATRSTTTESEQADADPDVTFVSFPDFFNFDVPNPMPDWDPAVNWFLDQVEAEDPDFAMVAGDMVDGRWYDSQKQVRHLGHVYYGGWVRRFDERDLTVHTVMGDHERGDNPWGSKKTRLQPAFEAAYKQYFDNPKNGPDGKEGLSYYVDDYLDSGLLVVGLDTHKVAGGRVQERISSTQLEWLSSVFEQFADQASFTIVQGHYPNGVRLRSRSSSGITIENSREFINTLKAHDVDAYFAGEFHAINADFIEGVWQVVHGASWGRVPSTNYLVGKVYPDRMTFELKSFPLDVQGETWNANKGNGPAASVEIPEDARESGPRSVGTLELGVDGSTITRSGKFV